MVSVYDTVITGVAFWTAHFHTLECFSWKSLLLLYKFINIHASKTHVWLYNNSFPCEKSQILLLEAMREEAVTVLERISVLNWGRSFSSNTVLAQTSEENHLQNQKWFCILESTRPSTAVVLHRIASFSTLLKLDFPMHCGIVWCPLSLVGMKMWININ